MRRWNVYPPVWNSQRWNSYFASILLLRKILYFRAPKTRVFPQCFPSLGYLFIFGQTTKFRMLYTRPTCALDEIQCIKFVNVTRFQSDACKHILIQEICCV